MISLDDDLRALPKAELHVHIEGTITPAMTRRLAARNKVDLDPGIFTPDGTAYRWENFLDLVTRVYQAMSLCMKTKEDYAEVTHDYLTRCADEGAIYIEFIAWPGQPKLSGISWKDIIDGMAEGIAKARKERGIDARINLTFERHNSVAVAEHDAGLMLSYPHELIVGLDIAGGEREGDIPQFMPVYQKVLKEFPRPLGVRLHALEGAGPANGRDALKLNPTRLGHGVRVIEDETLLREIVKRGIILEVCPTSNILAGIYPTYKEHPLRRLKDAGVRVCLNSDDPGLFGNSLGMEYQIARDHFGFSDAELLETTRVSIEGSYADKVLKDKMLSALAPRPAARPARG